MDWKDGTRSLSTRIWMTLQIDHWQIFWRSYVPSRHRRYYLALLFLQSVTRVATSVFVSESHFQHMSFTEVWYILFAVLSNSSSSSLEFVWWVYTAAENHCISAVYSPSVCCQLLQLCMHNPPKLHTYSKYVTCTHISDTTNTWRTEMNIYLTKSELC